MKWGVQVVKPSTHATGSTSLLVHFASGRYLFNCGEGTQRLCFENTLRISKLTAVFLTRVDWENMGGLPGMLLTLADAGMKNLTVCGGPNLTHALAATRHYMLRSGLGVGARELRDGDPAAAFRDANISVGPVHVYPDGYEPGADELGADESDGAAVRREMLARALGVYEEPAPQERRARRQALPQQQQKKGYYGDQGRRGEQCPEAGIESHLRRLEQSHDAEHARKRGHPAQDARAGGAQNQHLPPTRPTPVVLSYIVEGPEVPGKFDPKAARALGLAPGPSYRRLVEGESVTAPDGSVVRPEQCVGPARPSGIFILVDCPGTEYVASLTASTRFAPFFGPAPSEAGRRLLLVVHSLGPGVAQDARYQQWAARFPAHVRHMVSAPDYVADGNPFQRHLRVQASLAAIDPHTFVLPQAAAAAERPLDTFLAGRSVIAAHSMTMFDIEPKPLLDVSAVRQLLSPEEMLAKMSAEEADASGAAAAAAATMPTPAATAPQAPSPEAAGDSGLMVCTIGTGSSVPSIYRNVSANIVCVDGYGGMVLDCGESTVALLKRFLGHPARNPHNTRVRQSYAEFVASLRLLYISHMHADHHLGAVLLLSEWSRLTAPLDPRPRLTVVGPARFWVWLEDYAGVQDLGLDRVDFVSCRAIQIPEHAPAAGRNNAGPRPSEQDAARIAALKAGLGLADVATCTVVHCPWAYGLSLTHASGWKLVYSGDTRPCANLITLGRAGGKTPTILLHEATLADELIADAVAKRHTTVSEAVAMALGMGAENLLMTHFSQRCLALPRWRESRVQNVKVSRYGRIAGDAYDSGHGDGSPATDEVVPADDAKAPPREPGDPAPADESDADEEAQGTGNGFHGGLNIASAFDLSAFAPADIQRYREHAPRMKVALYREFARFMAEDAQAEDTQTEDTQAKDMKAKGAQAKGTRTKDTSGPTPPPKASKADRPATKPARPAKPTKPKAEK
ncbi:hypothetical protein H4R18_000828 [Coemansia javaensis]|uniref:ribonuclease Z n=1 Tax=Coemansia javaensis TaxID=2761396 RepID=A0A9W8LM78_9FUNG|nr:hypothetical protein H4R18_000828 [Coemansia javaensis]